MRIEFLKPYIVATWWCKPLILQILIILSIKYEVWIILGFKEIGMRKLEFVARTQFLWHVSVSSFFSNPIYIQRAEPSKYFKTRNEKKRVNNLNLIKKSSSLYWHNLLPPSTNRRIYIFYQKEMSQSHWKPWYVYIFRYKAIISALA